MCTSAPATGCAFESFTAPCKVEGPTGEAQAATPETSNTTKQIWSDLVIIKNRIELNRIDEDIESASASDNVRRSRLARERNFSVGILGLRCSVSASPGRFRTSASVPALQWAFPWLRFPSEECQFRGKERQCRRRGLNPHDLAIIG